MSSAAIEDRVAALEAEVARLWSQVNASEKRHRPWWEQIAGTFADDPIYEEAMRLGQAWRESFRP